MRRTRPLPLRAGAQPLKQAVTFEHRCMGNTNVSGYWGEAHRTGAHIHRTFALVSKNRQHSSLLSMKNPSNVFMAVIALDHTIICILKAIKTHMETRCIHSSELQHLGLQINKMSHLKMHINVGLLKKQQFK